MNRDELLKELDTAHGARAVAFGNNPTLYGDAANEIRQLALYIEQLKSDKHWLNERLLNAQTDIQLLEARARRND